MDKDTVVLLAARASRIENQDAIGASIVGMLRDLKEVVVQFYMNTSDYVNPYFLIIR